MNKILLSTLCMASITCVTSAMAQTNMTTTRNTTGYVTDSSGQVVRSGTGLCVHTGFYDPKTSYLEECDGPRPMTPVVVPAPMVVPPAPIVSTPPMAPAREAVHTTILFAFDSSVITSAEQQKLDRIITPDGRYDLSVVGYADPIGTDAYNMRLSQRRADAVVAYMKSRDVKTEQLSVSAKGESNTVVECAQKSLKARIDCNAPNRRVEINSK